MRRLSFVPAILLLLVVPPARAQGVGASRLDAERMLQAYLATWTDDARITAAAVKRFYAPRVDYYGHSFSRAEVLADKRAFIRAYPLRSYREVPGTLAGHCNEDRSRCHVTAEIAYRRTDRRGIATSGRARLGFDFVPADGGRKIERESARLLDEARS